jgi:hypothetical protein
LCFLIFFFSFIGYCIYFHLKNVEIKIIREVYENADDCFVFFIIKEDQKIVDDLENLVGEDMNDYAIFEDENNALKDWKQNYIDLHGIMSMRIRKQKLFTTIPLVNIIFSPKLENI